MRDAACYVCWSFARAYDPKQLEPFVPQLARYKYIYHLYKRSAASMSVCVGVCQCVSVCVGASSMYLSQWSGDCDAV